MSKPSTSSDKLRIGVLIHAPVQMLDLSPIDLFSMLTSNYLKACQLPPPLVALGVHIEIHYISSTPFSSSSPSTQATPLAPLTASAHLLLTSTISSPTVKPGTLDVILIPGPDPNALIPEEIGTWLRAHFETGNVTIMSVCTGALILATSGMLEGKEASAPRGLVPELRKKWPEVKWSDARRWVRSESGRIWTSGHPMLWMLKKPRCLVGTGTEQKWFCVLGVRYGPLTRGIAEIGGITNGLDMVAAYLKEKYSGPLADTVCMLADVGDRGEEYGTGNMAFKGMWIWTILRALFSGFRK